MYRINRGGERDSFLCLSCRKEIPVATTYLDMFVPDRHTAPGLTESEIRFDGLPPKKKGRPSSESLKQAYALRSGKLLDLFADRGKEPISFNCPNCHQPVTGNLKQAGPLRCSFCKRTYSPEEAICCEGFSLRLAFDDKLSYPTRCLPFAVPLSEAIHLARELFQRHRQQSRILQRDSLVENLVPLPFFLPAVLTDLRVIAKCRTLLRPQDYFLDLVNWPLPANHSVDIFLMDHIARWDFDDLVDFYPAEIKKANVLPKKSIFSTDDLVRLMLRERVNSAFRKAFGVSLKGLGSLSYELRTPQTEIVALPIYYAQLPLLRKNALIRIAINGQNGYSAMVIRQGIHFRKLHYDPYNIHPSGEATMNSIPVPVVTRKAGEAYAYPTEEASTTTRPLLSALRGKGLRADMAAEPWKHVL